MTNSEYFERETARLQNQQRGAQAALQNVFKSEATLGQITSSVERANQEALLQSQKALAQAELNRIAEDLRRLEMARQEREHLEAIQKQAQEKEAAKGQDQQKAEAAEKERQSKETFEKQEREKQEFFQKEQQQKADAAAKEQLEKEALQKQEHEREEARRKDGEAKQREENPISEIAAATAFSAAQAADALIEVAKSLAMEAEKKALEDRQRAEHAALLEWQLKERNDMLARMNQASQAQIAAALQRQEQVFQKQQEQLRIQQEKERQRVLDEQAREAADRAARAARDGLSL